MQDSNGQNLTYDYQKLDEYLTDMVGPLDVDQSFRNITVSLTQALLLAYNEGGSTIRIILVDSTDDLGILDEFFKIFAQMKRKGGES